MLSQSSMSEKERRALPTGTFGCGKPQTELQQPRAGLHGSGWKVLLLPRGMLGCAAVGVSGGEAALFNAPEAPIMVFWVALECHSDESLLDAWMLKSMECFSWGGQFGEREHRRACMRGRRVCTHECGHGQGTSHIFSSPPASDTSYLQLLQGAATSRWPVPFYLYLQATSVPA